MPRKLLALFLASALVIGSTPVSPSAAASGPLSQQTSVIAKNEPPLKPGAAAGVREAQGIADLDEWFITGLILAAIVAAILLANDDDNATNGTEAN